MKAYGAVAQKRLYLGVHMFPLAILIIYFFFFFDLLQVLFKVNGFMYVLRMSKHSKTLYGIDNFDFRQFRF